MHSDPCIAKSSVDSVSGIELPCDHPPSNFPLILCVSLRQGHDKATSRIKSLYVIENQQFPEVESFIQLAIEQ